MTTFEHKRLWRRLYRRKDRARYVRTHPAIRSHRISWQITPEARAYLFWQRVDKNAARAT